MLRTKAFLSFSHQDEEWCTRLMTHLAVLERGRWLHVWTDTRINLGDTWQTEIDNALQESKVAVLLISPAFLASKFIWEAEIPRIWKHRKEGMLVLPLIARPCAWKLEGDLAQLQARPANGRPLSLGNNAQIDLDLEAFTYELAAHLHPLSTHLAASSWETAEQFRHYHSPSYSRSMANLPPTPSKSPTRLPFLDESLPLSWTGRYLPNQNMRLTILTAAQEQVQGIITYLNEGIITHIAGRITSDYTHIASERIWAFIHDIDLPQVVFAIEFWETACEPPGAKEIDPNGRYFALATRRSMQGVWAQGETITGYFSFEIDEAGVMR